MIDPNHRRLSIVRQCELVTISRSSFYYEGKGETVLNLELMRLIDEEFLENLYSTRFPGQNGTLIRPRFRAWIPAPRPGSDGRGAREATARCSAG